MKKLPLHITITQQQRDQLAALHAATRVPTAERVRQAIDAMLAKYAGVDGV